MHLQVCSGLRARQTKITPLSVVTSRSLCSDFSAENVYCHTGPQGDVNAGLNSALIFTSMCAELLTRYSRFNWDRDTQKENWPLGFSSLPTCNQIFRSLCNQQSKYCLLEDLSEEQTNLLGHIYFYFLMATEVQEIPSTQRDRCIHRDHSETFPCV